MNEQMYKTTMNEHKERQAEFETRFNMNLYAAGEAIGSPRAQGSNTKKDLELAEAAHPNTLITLNPTKEEESMQKDYSRFLVSDLHHNKRLRKSLCDDNIEELNMKCKTTKNNNSRPPPQISTSRGAAIA